MSYLVLSVCPGQERKLLEKFKKADMLCSLPLAQRTHRSRRSRRMYTRTEARFPGYIFVHPSSVAQLLLGAVQSIHIFSFVKFGVGYALISEQAIDRLANEEPEEITFNSGDKVRVDGGPFVSQEGIFIRHVNDQESLLQIKNAITTFKIVMPTFLLEKIS